MRKAIAVSSFLLVAALAGAQPRNFAIVGGKLQHDTSRTIPSWNPNLFSKGKLTGEFARPVRDTLRLPYNGMPNAIIYRSKPDIYVGNNGQGQDIYRSQVDNMSILKPDSTFYSAMPMDTRTLRGTRTLSGNENIKAQSITNDPAKKPSNSSSRE